MYFSKSTSDPAEILAGLESGTLTKWRQDSNGEVWYRQFPTMIHGVAVPTEYEDEQVEDEQVDDELVDELTEPDLTEPEQEILNQIENFAADIGERLRTMFISAHEQARQQAWINDDEVADDGADDEII